MHAKVIVFGLILLMQACGPLLAATPAPEENDSPGIVQTLIDRAREAKARVQQLHETVVGFIGAYHEDHIQPVTDDYVEWAHSIKSAVWEKIRTTIDNYSPFSSFNATEAN